MLVFHKYFVDVILPLPLERNFTYAVTEAESKFIQPGVRVCVPFGKNKIYTGIVYKLHNIAPTSYDCKSIHSILDSKPIVTLNQFRLWSWISEYYMCNIGDVMSASIPNAYLLKSETLISQNPDLNIETNSLSDDEYLVIEALKQQSVLRVEEIQSILNKKNIFSIINPLIESKILTTSHNLVQKFKPRLVRCVKFSKEFSGENFLEKLEAKLTRAKKLRSIVLCFVSLASKQSVVKVSNLRLFSSATSSQIRTLITKGIFEEFFIEVDRIGFDSINSERIINLSHDQSTAFDHIKKELSNKSSGHLMD